MTYSIEYRVNGFRVDNNNGWIESIINVETIEEAKQLTKKHTLQTRIIDDRTGQIVSE